MQVRFSKKIVVCVLLYVGTYMGYLLHIVSVKDLSSQVCGLLQVLTIAVIGIATTELGFLWKARETEKQLESKLNINEKTNLIEKQAEE